ncbi:hypothetical protein RN001_009159 [Aquatica leii]|uniref:Uncharacterized protein n=1 Tax=Aquatica leii TaxID=1421715 RepID=A0AAN7P692_9COLE|nr:hypothetical protein RN001_009159 [Aquatica leii]
MMANQVSSRTPKMAQNPHESDVVEESSNVSTNDIDVDAILNAPILFEDELAPTTIRGNVSPKRKNGTNNMININDLSDVNETTLGHDLVSITTNEDISKRPTSHEIKCTNNTIKKLMIESVPTTTKDLNNSGVVNVPGDKKLNTEERSVPITTSEELFDTSPLKDLNSNQENLIAGSKTHRSCVKKEQDRESLYQKHRFLHRYAEQVQVIPEGGIHPMRYRNNNIHLDHNQNRGERSQLMRTYEQLQAQRQAHYAALERENETYQTIRLQDEQNVNYGEYGRPGSRSGSTDPIRFTHYVNYNKLQNHLSRKQHQYQSQRQVRSDIQLRPVSNFF